MARVRSDPRSFLRQAITGAHGAIIQNADDAGLPEAPLLVLENSAGSGDGVGATLEELEAMVRFVAAPFGPLTDAQWRHLTVTGAKQHADGSWGFRYDPGIGIPFRKQPLADVDLWQYWDTIACPTLLLRGAQSDLLPKDTAIAMTQRGPRPRLVEFEGIGHAPMLMADDQIKVVRDFLLEG